MSRNSGQAAMLLPLPPTLIPPPVLASQGQREWFRVENQANDNEAHIYIFDELTPFWGIGAQDVLDQIKEIDAEKINVHINSPGGSAFEGVAIYNALVQHPSKIIIQGDGLVASAASIVAQAGDEVIMNAGSMMMIHDASSGSYGNAGFHREIADLLDKLSMNIAGVYAMRAGFDADYWREFMRAETWYTSQEAVDAGLADRVSGKTAPDTAIQDSWFKVFNYGGRLASPSPEQVRVAVMNKLEEKAVAGENTNVSASATTPPANSENVNQPSFAGVMIAGSMVSDAAAIQAHVTTIENRNRVLEQAAEEAATEARREFVRNLASPTFSVNGQVGARILASQVGDDNAGLTQFALSLTDEQFASWRATWDAVPPTPLLQSHGTNQNGGQPAPSSTQTRDEAAISDAQEIVRTHMRGNMSRAALVNTPSYRLLKERNALPEGA